MSFNIPKGTKDVLPEDSYKWHYIEDAVREVTRLFDVKEIRTPTFEHTELFLRGVGDTTDIVNKEMYTFIDKGNRSITLKPEGTAGVARSFVENSLYAGPLPVKTYYVTPVFRYERPQSGRLREHHQFGVELYGSYGAEMDVEAISIAKALFDRLGLDSLVLNINSIGCPVCRKEYNKALKAYYSERIDSLCETCRGRLEKNPLRILDCKEEKCIEINNDAPVITDYLCDDCNKHMEDLKKGLDTLGIAYEVNPRIVRGLDYYTRTVFEFVSDSLGAKSTVCGGGRYDNLVEEVGGKPCPSVGFGMGIERLILTLEATGKMPAPKDCVDMFLGYAGEELKYAALKIVNDLRKKGISADTEFTGRSVKAQMKYAGKIGARFTAILGADEIESGIINIKNMTDGSVKAVSISDITGFFKEADL
ncbi:MAG: histidine--tRNA ligase [Eubacteriales bacterium]|nr:histidine--tRNA ligase [Christensenellaceae bacterium]MDY2750725.1 histidine--tRNA ligase [Eubacteriales bacterium]MDY4709157.1 histidine--tRNA ligase [Eubacteriales bacterium]